MQFGSTGKGAIASYLVRKNTYDISIRVQSIQAGHTIYFEGKPYKMRTIPCAWVDPRVELVLGAGCFIDKQLLLDEIALINGAMSGDVRDRLRLDFRATYILPEDEHEEVSRKLDTKMGSTAHGAGASLIRKLWRDSPPTRVVDDDWADSNGLAVVDSIKAYENAYALVEGCQGAMLSIHTSPYYPNVTSRECTVAGVISEVGLAPRDVAAVHGVFRTYPIRVGGNSGQTGAKELTWDEMDVVAGRHLDPERTTVTNRVRRIFEFSIPDFKQAMLMNKPDRLYMTFADYLGGGIYGKTSLDDLPPESRAKLDGFLVMLKSELDVSPCWIGTGEREHHFIEMA